MGRGVGRSGDGGRLCATGRAGDAKQIVRNTIDASDDRPNQLVTCPELRVVGGEGRDFIAGDPRCRSLWSVKLQLSLASQFSGQGRAISEPGYREPMDMMEASTESM